MKVRVELTYDSISVVEARNEILRVLGSKVSDLVVTPERTNEDLGWSSDDITFCSSECDRLKCYRHPTNIRYHNLPHSFADMKGTKFCDLKR